ncbi:GTPase Der [Clostridia bacterium]|nr:GTPase Der [Clostridia bacterium]
MKPIIAIIGRPNVGKSTFFNKMTGTRIAIVQDEPGVTRDRIYADAEWRGRRFTLVDTGGIELKSGDAFFPKMLKSTEEAVRGADLALLFTDYKDGVTAADFDAAQFLRKSGKPAILVVNKADNFAGLDVSDFYALNLGEPFPISSEHGLNTGDLLDKILDMLPERGFDDAESGALKIAVVGKPNAGKSSLVNRILKKDRVIVSEIPGTTRDAVDTLFSYNGKDYVIIDTAGIRRKRSVDEGTVESYGVLRAFEAIRRCDVAVLVLDAGEPLSEQDLKIAGFIDEQGKPSVIALNKWDIIEKDTFTIERYNQTLEADLAFMKYYKALTISALTGQRTEKLMELIDVVHANASKRVTTGLLNDIINNAVATTEPPSFKGRRLKILYASQTGVCPPAFVLKVNDSGLVHFSYLRYLENSIRAAVDFSGTPIKIVARND